MASKKDYNINFLKALGIILVILGHSMILYQPGWGIFTPYNSSKSINYIKTYIDTIQMPLFVSVSGYLFFFGKEKYSNMNILFKNKFKRLLIPFITTTLLYVIPIRLAIHYIYYPNLKSALTQFILGTNVGHTWFLLMLFLLFMGFYFLYKHIHSEKLLLVLLLFFYIISVALPSIYQIKRTFLYAIFFYIGFLINKYKYRLASIKKYAFLLIVINLATFLIYFNLNVTHTIFLKLLKHLIFLPCSLSLLFLLYYWSSLIDCKKIMNYKLANIINKNNFGLYLFHEPIIYVIFYYLNPLNINPYIVVFLSFIISSIVSILITQLIRLCRLNLLIGE